MKKKLLIVVCVALVLGYAASRCFAKSSNRSEFPDGAFAYLYIGLMNLKPADIFQASERGDFKRVAKLVKRKPELANARSDAGWTPLYLATIGHHTDIVEFLISKGADVNAPNGVLDYRAIGAANPDIAKILLDHGADVSLRQIDGKTALHGCGEDTVELLIAHGAEVDARDGEGRTPLHFAVEREIYLRKAELLIARGADVNAADNSGITPFQVAAKAGNLPGAKLLIEHGARTDTVDNNGNTSMHWAIDGCSQRNVIAGNLEIIETLIASGADVGAVDNEGNTPMHRAAACNCPEAVDILVKRGASVKVRNKKGETPLHLVASGQYAENVVLVRKLIENGADVNAKNDFGETPLTYATRAFRNEVADELRKNGGVE